MSIETEHSTEEKQDETNALMALLYPEDGDLSDSNENLEDSVFSKESDAYAELADYRKIRTWYQDVPEEDAPGSVSNKLLALAAQHAPKKEAAHKGLFARLGNFLMPLMMHPGLAAAASLILVGGLAGTLYLRGGGGMAPEPTIEQASKNTRASSLLPEHDNASDKKRVTGAAAATPPEEGLSLKEETLEKLEKEEPAMDSVSLSDENLERAGSLKGKAVQVVSSKQWIAKQGIERKQKTKTYPRAKSSSDFGSKTGKRTSKKQGAAGSLGSSLGSSLPISAPSAKASQPKDLPPSESVADDESIVEEKREEESGLGQAEEEIAIAEESAPGAKKEDSTNSKVRALYAQARIAAKKGQCNEVRTLGKKVNALSRKYFRQVFSKDTTLGACLVSSKNKKKN